MIAIRMELRELYFTPSENPSMNYLYYVKSKFNKLYCIFIAKTTLLSSKQLVVTYVCCNVTLCVIYLFMYNLLIILLY